MSFYSPSRRSWLIGLLVGVVLGTVVLGVGSRIAMRGIVVLAGGSPGFSIGGTATVIFLGTIAGVAGAIVLLGLRWILATRPVLRGAVFWLFLLLITLRGLQPIDPPRLLLFMPLVVVYGVLLQVVSCRLEARRGAPDPATLGVAA